MSAAAPARPARALLLVLLALLLGGCAAWRDWRAGVHTPAVAAGDPALQARLERLYADGAAALAGGDIDATLVAWRAYARQAPRELPQARRVRGYLTLLERESARRFAREAVARERAGQGLATASAPARADPLHVALFPLRGEGLAGAREPFGRALLAMLSVDLAKVPAITLLERERIDALLRERQLAASGLVAPDAAALQAQARLLGAGSVVAGLVINEPSPEGPGAGRYRIHTAVSDVVAGRVVGTQEADGRQAEFFVLQKQIVRGILDTLGVKEIPPEVERVHTRSWAAYARFAAGLAALAEDRYDDARTAFRAALAIDPGFALAEDAFAAVPERAATPAQIAAEAAARPR
jgi:tetratricopeptide (TPR) repeat protein